MLDEDSKLLRRYADEKSERAFAELVRRHLDLVYSVALRQTNGDAALAQDVAQTVFTALAGKAEELASRPVLGGWLYRTAQFAAIDAVRAESRRRAREAEAEIMKSLASDPSTTVDWEKLRPTLDQVIGELKDEDRDAVVLRFFEAKSFADVGARLHLTENSARMRVERALDKLHALLAKRGVTSTSAALALALANQVGVAAPTGLAASVTGVALASVADDAATTVVGFLQFMSTIKFIAGAAAIIAAVALGIAGLKVRARHGAEAELASVNRRSAALAAGLRDTEQRATIAEQRSAELKQKVEAARAQAAADAEAAKVAAEWDPIKEGKAFTQRHPEILQALINWEESLADWNHPKLYKALGFTSAQIAEFRKLQRQLSSGERVTLPGIPTMLVRPYDNALPSSEVYRQLRDLVGVEKRKIYEDVMANDRRSARFITYHMIGALCFTDTPISPQQAEQIIQAFGGRPAAPAYFDLAAVDSKVRGVISAAQVPAWEAEMAEQQIQRAIVAQRKPPPPRPATTK